MITRKYSCPLAIDKAGCQFGGVKRFKCFGGMPVARPYCRKSQCWIDGLLTGKRIPCPLRRKVENETNNKQNTKKV